jgi:hypothetical protein
MNRCLSEQALLLSYIGEGTPADMSHLKSCLTCAGRYKAIEGDLALITEALQSPPPRRRLSAGWLPGWRLAVSALALSAAFMFGWSLRATSVAHLSVNATQVARQQAVSSEPMQLSLAERTDTNDGVAPAMYAAYVQGAFADDSCADTDPLGPGCP